MHLLLLSVAVLSVQATLSLSACVSCVESGQYACDTDFSTSPGWMDEAYFAKADTCSSVSAGRCAGGYDDLRNYGMCTGCGQEISVRPTTDTVYSETITASVCVFYIQDDSIYDKAKIKVKNTQGSSDNFDAYLMLVKPQDAYEMSEKHDNIVDGKSKTATVTETNKEYLVLVVKPKVSGKTYSFQISHEGEGGIPFWVWMMFIPIGVFAFSCFFIVLIFGLVGCMFFISMKQMSSNGMDIAQPKYLAQVQAPPINNAMIGQDPSMYVQQPAGAMAADGTGMQMMAY